MSYASPLNLVNNQQLAAAPQSLQTPLAQGAPNQNPVFNDANFALAQAQAQFQNNGAQQQALMANPLFNNPQQVQQQLSAQYQIAQFANPQQFMRQQAGVMQPQQSAMRFQQIPIQQNPAAANAALGNLLQQTNLVVQQAQQNPQQQAQQNPQINPTAFEKLKSLQTIQLQPQQPQQQQQQQQQQPQLVQNAGGIVWQQPQQQAPVTIPQQQQQVLPEQMRLMMAQAGIQMQPNQPVQAQSQQIDPLQVPFQQIRMMIDECLRHYMTQQDTISFLTSKNPSLDRKVIELLWAKLEQENADFFRAYNIRLKIKQQILDFNNLVQRQASLMQQQGVVVQGNSSMMDQSASAAQLLGVQQPQNPMMQAAAPIMQSGFMQPQQITTTPQGVYSQPYVNNPMPQFSQQFPQDAMASQFGYGAANPQQVAQLQLQLLQQQQQLQYQSQPLMQQQMYADPMQQAQMQQMQPQQQIPQGQVPQQQPQQQNQAPAQQQAPQQQQAQSNGGSVPGWMKNKPQQGKEAAEAPQQPPRRTTRTRKKKKQDTPPSSPEEQSQQPQPQTQQAPESPPHQSQPIVNTPALDPNVFSGEFSQPNGFLGEGFPDIDDNSNDFIEQFFSNDNKDHGL